MKINITDPVLLGEALVKTVNYLFDAEKHHFEETFSDFVGFDSQDSYEEAIEKVEAIPGGTGHIFYLLLILKLGYKELFEEHEDGV